MIVGCYTLDLYCRYSATSRSVKEGVTLPFDRRHYNNSAQTTGRNLREAKREAVEAGWRFSGGDVTCPECVKDPSYRIDAAKEGRHA